VALDPPRPERDTVRMKILLILAAVVLAVAVYLAMGRSAAPAAPAPASTPSSGPGALVDGIQTQLDFKVKAATVTKITTERNALKQLLADSEIDADRKREALDRVKVLEGDVAAAREQLIAGGQSSAVVDKWLKDNHWDEVQDLAKQVASK
jgi:hypothetical protein